MSDHLHMYKVLIYKSSIYGDTRSIMYMLNLCNLRTFIYVTFRRRDNYIKYISKSNSKQDCKICKILNEYAKLDNKSRKKNER